MGANSPGKGAAAPLGPTIEGDLGVRGGFGSFSWEHRDERAGKFRENVHVRRLGE